MQIIIRIPKSTFLVIFLLFSLIASMSPLTQGYLPPSVQNANIDHNFVVLDTQAFGSSSLYYPRWIQAGYINPDGVLRLIVGSSQFTNFSFMVLKQNSSNPLDFEIESIISYDNENYSYCEPLLVYDFDEDGVAEVLLYLSSSNGRMIFLGWNTTTSSYSEKWTSQAAILSVTDFGAAIADVDLDGEIELIQNQGTTTRIFSWDSPGFKNFRLDKVLTGGAYGSIGIGDVDNDSVPEIITGNYGVDSTIYIHSWNGSDYITEFTTSFSGAVHSKGFNAIHVADVNNDGLSEIYAGTPNWALPAYPIVKFSWDGSEFTAENITLNTAATYAIVSGDIDADGFDEVLVDLNAGPSGLIEIASNGSTIYHEYSITAYMKLILLDLTGDAIPEIISGPNSYLDHDLIYSDTIALPPTILSEGDREIIKGGSDRISWIILSKDSGSFAIYMDNSLIYTTSIISGDPVEIDTSSLSSGVYNFTIVAETTNGITTNTVWITISGLTTTTSTSTSTSPTSTQPTTVPTTSQPSSTSTTTTPTTTINTSTFTSTTTTTVSTASITINTTPSFILPSLFTLLGLVVIRRRLRGNH
ncbi:MAG: FG-GAP repeat domain-containing protein [Candidatus Hodarchaeales archaeon]